MCVPIKCRMGGECVSHMAQIMESEEMQLLEGYVATVAQQGGVLAPRGNYASFKGCILYINEAVQGGV